VHRARKRKGRSRRTGDGSSERGDPHHVNVRAIEESFVDRPAPRCRRQPRRLPGDGRCPGPRKRTPFTRPPRNRSWRPSSLLIEREQRPRWVSEEEATGMPAALLHGSPRGRITPRGATDRQGAQWGSRRENAALPGLTCIERPRAPRCLVLSPPGEKGGTRSDIARVGTWRKPRHESCRSLASKGVRERWLRRETTSTSVRFGVSECRSRSKAPPFRVSTGVNDITHGPAE